MTPIPSSVASLTEEPKGDATDESNSTNAGDDADDSLEAILLQAGAKPPETAAVKALGSKTLMGIGIEGLNLPARLRAEAKKTKADAKAKSKAKSHANNDANGEKKAAASEGQHPDVPVDDLVEDGLDVVQPTQEAAVASSPEDKPVRSLLDDVAQALNVQASEVRDRARGRLPGMPGAGPAKGIDPKVREPGQLGAEFEDPSEGPTALTPGMIAIAEAEKATGQKSELDAEQETEEEAVVLGHAVQSGSAKYAQARASDSRPVAVPPVPGLPAAAPAVVGPPPGVSLKLPTPVGGLPLPLSGRARLPTPVSVPPGHPAAISYQTLPFGMASPVVSDLTATAPSTPISLEASRRFAASASASMGSDAVPVRRTLRITEPVVRLATVLPAVLTAHVKLATLSLAGLIAVTFAGGLFVGMVVGKGQGRAEPPAAARIGGSEPLTATAPATPTPTVSHVVGVAPGAATGSPTPAAAAPAVTPSAVSGAATSAAAPVAPSEATVTPQPEAQPPEAARDSKAKKPGVALRPPRPRRPAVAGTATATDLPPAGGKLVVSKPTTATKPAVAASKPTVLASKPTAHSVVAPSTASKPMANNAAAKPAPKSKTKTTWHDPFAD